MILKAARPWVASPLGFNVLLSLLKGKPTPTVEKYAEVAQLADKTKGCQVINKLFISSSSGKNLYNLLNTTDIEMVDFSKNGNVFTNYINNYENMRFHEFSSKTEYILTNVTSFEGGWQCKEDRSPEMKIYNTFNYTQDVKFDGRLLELPLCSEFKLILVLPNVTDVLEPLFATLATHGFAAAVESLQPLFTAKPKLPAPNFELRSRVEVKEKIGVVSMGATIQYGSIAVSDEGTRVTVVTCIYSPKYPAVKMDDQNSHDSNRESPPLYFAILYDDTPIFIGDFNREQESRSMDS